MLGPPCGGINQDRPGIPRTRGDGEPAYRIQLIEKTFAILEVFDPEHSDVGDRL